MRILVTGAAGFIGCNYVINRLENQPDDAIVSLDKLTYAGNLSNLSPVMDDPRHTFVKGDIADEKFLRMVFEKPFDAVLNFAAETHVDRSITDPKDFLTTNVMGTFALLERMKENGAGLFIQISTDEVYGSLGFDDPPFTESTPLSPSSPYSASKAAADQLALSYFRTYKTPVMITRCSNNYGPYQFPEKMLPLFINNLLNNKPVPIYGKGENVRDWIHVADHCRAIDAVLEKGKPGEVYNIGGDCERKNIEVAEKLLEIMGKPETLKSFVKDRPGHDLRYAMDFSKISEELGWSPVVDFESGLRDTVRWYIDNAEWLKRVTSGEYREYYEKMYKRR